MSEREEFANRALEEARNELKEIKESFSSKIRD